MSEQILKCHFFEIVSSKGSNKPQSVLCRSERHRGLRFFLVRLSCLCVCTAVLHFAAVSKAQTGCSNTWNDGQGAVPGPSAPFSQGVDNCAASRQIGVPSTSPTFASRCHLFKGSDWGGPMPLGAANGFSLNIDPQYALGPSDYPPRKTNPIESSLPLVSKESLQVKGRSPFRERPSHNDVVDLVTGVPLYQEVDFELPFGGATFRHVRTYSWTASELPLTNGGGLDDHAPYDEPPDNLLGSMWDWNGYNWMMSENPIFLIDAAYSSSYEDQDMFAPDSKRCYFIPDAHHAIPFRFDATTSTYAAPPWFDAKMAATTDTSKMDVLGRPLEFYVWLQRGSIKYTISASYEDTWTRYDSDSASYVDVHQPRSSGGLGIPYLGFVTQIEDRNGNRAEYVYCDFKQENQDDPSTANCQECSQHCNEKGQIKAIKLRSADGNVEWSLLYTHRAFKLDGTDRYYAYEDERQNQNALHSIHVYKGDKAIPSGCLTIPATDFWGQQSLDAIENYNLQGAIPDDWYLEVKYLYSEPRYYDPWHGPIPASVYCLSGDSTGDWAGPNPDNYTTMPDGSRFHEEREGFHLLKTRVTKRAEIVEGVGLGAPETHTTMYRRTWEANSDGGQYMVFSDSTINKILEARRQQLNNATLGANSLFSIGNGDLTPYIDATTGHVTQKSLTSVADLVFTPRTWLSTGCYVSPRVDQLIAFLGLPAGGRTSFLEGYPAIGAIDDRRKDSTNNGRFQYINLVTTPESIPSVGLNIWFGWAMSYHYPYLIDVYSGGSWDPLPLDRVCFTTVIDEITDPLSYNYGTTQGVKSRHAVEMNAAGFIMRDRTWSCEGSGCSLTSQAGVGEEIISDCKGRVLERRTKSWGSPKNGNKSSDGLIYFYEYENDCPPITSGQPVNCDSCSDPLDANQQSRPGEIIAEGIKRGSNGAKIYTRKYDRDPIRADLAKQEIRFRNPTSSLQPTAADEVIETYYEFDQSKDGKPMTYKQIKRPPAPRTAEAGSPTFYAVERFAYDTYGHQLWYGVGTLADPGGEVGNPYGSVQADDEFYPTLTKHAYWGLLVYSIVDFERNTAHPCNPNLPGYDYALPPNDDQRFARRPVATVDSPALNLETQLYWKNVDFPDQILFPNGRQQRRYRTWWPDLDPGCTNCYQEWSIEDSTIIDPNPLIPCLAWACAACQDTWPAVQGHIRFLTPIKVSHFKDGQLKWVKSIRKEPVHYNDRYMSTFQESEVISTSTAKYDANGRFVGMVTEGQGDNSSIAAGIFYDGFGQVARQQDPDGTVTRNEYDEMGRLEKIYKGTNDTNDYWQTGVPCDPQGNPPGCYDPNNPPANMTLVEKRYYSKVVCTNAPGPCVAATDFSPINSLDGVYDIDQLSKVRNYRDKPNYLYGPPPGQESNQDSIGWLSEHVYDWRQRLVWVCKKDSNGQPLTHSITYYDHLGRERIVAEYGSSAPTIEPTREYTVASTTSSGLPTGDQKVAELLAASTKPFTITQTLYNKRGQVEESRQYNVAIADGTSYTSTLNYYNYWDKPVEVHSLNSPIIQYQYDAKGREVKSSTLARTSTGFLEMARAETQYDNNDRPTVVTRIERLHSSTTGVLSDSNSVKSWIYTWYDATGKTIATANFGTNSTEDKYVSGSAPPAYSDIAPPLTLTTDFTVGTCNHSAYSQLSVQPQITCYSYDTNGRREAVFSPDGTVTRTQFDTLGRETLVTQNADDPNAQLRQKTGYVYDSTTGQLEQIKAILPDGTAQITEMIYGADVVDSGWGTISQNNSFIKEVQFPDRDSGGPSTTGDHFLFKYYPDGSVAERTDQRGVVFRYRYDELGRLVETTVNDLEWYPQPGSGQGEFRPPNRVSRIEYSYTVDGMPSLVTAYAKDMYGVESALSENSLTYDEHRNLTQEMQNHIGLTLNETPVVDYAWDYQPHLVEGQPTGGNHNRLTGITYPAKLLTDNARRTITLGYDSGTLDDALSRIASLTSSGVTGPLATYQYAGSGRRVGKTMSNGKIVQSLWGNGAAGYERMDRFGRVKDLHTIKLSGGTTIRRDEYGYNDGMGSSGCGCSSSGTSGDRVYDRVTQKEHAGVNHDNDRSWKYEYDALHRLKRADVGALDSANGSIVPTAVDPLPVQATWNLDNLGNWTGNSEDAAPIGFHQTGDFNGNGIADDGPRDFAHRTNAANEIHQHIRYDEMTYVPTVTTFIHDPAGNLAFDGQYVYQYDGWNRLIQVNVVGELPPDWNGRVLGATELGALVCRYTYDGLGRLILKETPITAGQDTPLQRKDLYYDGVRRIVETIRRGSITTVNGGNDEAAAIESGGGGGANTSQQPTAPYLWTDREYVYGPEYVDEFVCQFSFTTMLPATTYFVQDANYNVVALTNALGNLLEQISYDPYGTVNAVDHFAAHAVNRVGHQGLFFERFDGNYDQPCIAPNIAGLYYNRNRFYSPTLGRFITRDPNETGMPIQIALSINGDSLRIVLAPFDGIVLFGNGSNLYQYLSSRPLTVTDPLGLFSLIELVAVVGIQAESEALAGAYAAAGTVAAFALFKTIQGVQAILLALAAEIADAAGGSCYCMCIKPNPHAPGTNSGPDPVGRMTKAQCMLWPQFGGKKEGYSYCYCRR